MTEVPPLWTFDAQPAAIAPWEIIRHHLDPTSRTRSCTFNEAAQIVLVFLSWSDPELSLLSVPVVTL